LLQAGRALDLARGAGDGARWRTGGVGQALPQPAPAGGNRNGRAVRCRGDGDGCMKKSLWALIPLVLFLALVVLLYNGLGRDTEELPSTLVGQPVPAFSLPSLIGEDRMLGPKLFEDRW